MAAVLVLLPAVVAEGAVGGSAYTPLGNRHHYLLTRAYDGGVKRDVIVRWNPCRTITYRVNPSRGGIGALSDARKAIGRLEAAGGLRFRYLGKTSYVPPGKPTTFLGQRVYAFDPVAQRAATGADLVIAWARPGSGPGRSRLLDASGEYGVGGYHYDWSFSSRLRITSGMAIIRSDIPLKPGFGRGLTRGHFLLHELGHAVGLAHYDDGVQVMTQIWNSSNSSPAQYNAGDITGLHRVGRAAGCIRP